MPESMRDRLNTFVDFRGDFPKSDPMKEIPGAEVAAMLVAGLSARGCPVRGLEAVDFEQIIDCDSGTVRFQVRVWIDWEGMDRWEICIPPTVGCLGGLLGRSDREEHKRLLEVVDSILRSTDGVRDIRWFPNFEISGYRERCKWYPGPLVVR